MQFELRNLMVVEALSEETACYTAEIWIDGAPAFHASNRGQGSADLYRQLGQYTEAEVNDWLASNRPPRCYRGITLEPTLEFEVACLIDELENVRLLRRQLRTQLVTIEGGQVFSYALRKQPVTLVAKAVLARRPEAEIVNLGGEPALKRAVRILLDQSAHDEACAD